MIDELELRSRFPGIPWDQPVRVHVAGYEINAWVCRYCIAMHGLRAADIGNGSVEFAFHSREDALAHVDTLHHE